MKDELKEDGMAGGAAPMNAVGGGNIAGLGVGKQGEPGISRKKKIVSPFMSFIRRKEPKL